MKKLLNSLREIRNDLRRSIFVGERYEKNVRGIVLGASLILVINLITCYMNWINGYRGSVASGLVLILASLLIIYFIAARKDRRTAVAIGFVAVILTYTYDAVFAFNGIVIYWTLLLPLAFCYLISVRHGIALSCYFLALYGVMFCTPLMPAARSQYDPIVIERFPILYLADVILTTYIMVQYHENTLHQMDYADQLLKAKETADAANAAKSSFLTNMSHEIRTPINAVLGMNEMILRESQRARTLTDSDRGAVEQALGNIGLYASDVESAGNNLLAIINDILDLSKIEAGKMDLVEHPYQLSSVLNDVSNMVYFKARDKGLDFVVDVDETLPDRLLGDELRVRQIITNLLSNAVKYTEHGLVRFSLRAEEPVRTPGERVTLKITVEDTGIGIRQEDADKLFTKFQRLDMKQNSTVEGTGLGLVITRNLLNMMGGSITVASEYGKGSVFTVALPQQVASETPIGDFQKHFQDNVPRSGTYRESFRAPEARVLIVDDTRMNLTVAVGLLSSTGMQIDTALSGAESIELAERTSYDLILMDQRMPGMDGTEALHAIRADEQGLNRATPVICLTADAVIGAREHYLAEGFTGYLTKPIDSRALEKLLIQLLPQDKLIRGRAEPDAAPEAENAEETVFAPLREVGVDPALGLRYCQHDEAFYRSILREYARSEEEKVPELEKACAARDWKSYAVVVHALKSSSRMIGATALADIAARLEAEANRGDGEAVRRDHAALLSGCGALVGAIRSLEAESPADDEGGDVLEFAPDSGDVLEFAPDGEA